MSALILLFGSEALRSNSSARPLPSVSFPLRVLITILSSNLGLIADSKRSSSLRFRSAGRGCRWAGMSRGRRSPMGTSGGRSRELLDSIAQHPQNSLGRVSQKRRQIQEKLRYAAQPLAGRDSQQQPCCCSGALTLNSTGASPSHPSEYRFSWAVQPFSGGSDPAIGPVFQN
jgi:hypothetical protein